MAGYQQGTYLMHGQNPIKHQDEGDGQTLHVVKGSPFLTLQGEGPYTGWPAVFIRLHGCNLRCTFCDTNFSDPNDPVMELETLVGRAAALNNEMSERLFVITGGEPLRQNIAPLCKALSELDDCSMVQIETAGTLWVPGIERHAQIVCSPKTPAVHHMIQVNADAFKYVVSATMEFDGFIPITATQPGTRAVRLAEPERDVPVYLSPLDEGDEELNRANRAKVAELAMKYGVIAGLQVHKIFELP
jgi:7-carboxy-7-deazaguanine synthase